MVNRYCAITDIQSYLDITIDTVNYPKQSLVEDWITASENDIDSFTDRKFDAGTETEFFSPQVASYVLWLKRTPITSITSISENTGTDFVPVWTALTSGVDYITESNDLGLVRTKVPYYGTKKLKADYVGGSATISLDVKELCVAMVKKRYYESILGISSLDTELVSISSIRVSEKSNDAIKFSVVQLDKEIADKLRKLSGASKSQMFGIGVY